MLEQYEEVDAQEQARWRELEKSASSWVDVWEQKVDCQPQSVVLIEAESGRSWTYQELDRWADRVAASTRGSTRIGLHLPNGGPFLATLLGLAKAGVEAVLLNTREPGWRERAAASGCSLVLNDYRLLDGPWPGRPGREVRQHVALDDPAVYIFTSGTTGPGKAARFSHRRLIGAGVAWSVRTRMTADDRCYIPLPLYHGNGLAVAFASCVEAGATAVVRDRFSARAFLSEVRQYGCTAAVYIGELWRYIDSLAARPDDADNPLRVIFGNGLGPELWRKTVARFGIQRVVEHYGTTELPAGALTNWVDQLHAGGKVGSCGYLPPHFPGVLLIDADGSEVSDGELLMRVPGGTYRGYLNLADDSTRLLTRDGELWWRSGDRLRRDAEGYFWYVERLGESFRWKGETVSPSEVESALRSQLGSEDLVVYGVQVPHHPGSAGMAALVQELPLPEDLAERLRSHLAPYALPLFLKTCASLPTTSTLKHVRHSLSEEGFTTSQFVLLNGRYQPVTPEIRAALFAGTLRL